MKLSSKQIAQVGADILAQGYVVLDDVITADEGQVMLNACLAIEPEHFFTAGVGRHHGHQINADIRGDKMTWLADNFAGTLAYMQSMEAVKLSLNQWFYLGLNHYELMFASYPIGAFYQKHMDTFVLANGTKNQRKISTVLYLNQAWQDADGGELVLYLPQQAESGVVIEPVMGRLVMFVSDEIPHEVLVTHQLRHSLTGWFRTAAGH